MIKNKLLFVYFFSFSFLLPVKSIYAQSSTEITDNHQQIEIEVFGDLFFGSKVVSYNLLHTLLWGGTVSANMKNQVNNRLSDQNDFHADIKYGIHFQWHTKKLHRLGFTYKGRNFAEYQFSKNFFKTLMYGNAQWDTLRVDLGNQSINQHSYSDLFFSYEAPTFQMNDHLNFIFSLAGGVRLGHNILLIDAPTTWLQTKALSEAIHISSDIDFRQNRTHVINGIGAGLDISATLEGTFRHKNGNWHLNLHTEDIGFIRWNGKSTHFNQQYDIFFDGISVEPSLSSNSNIAQRFQDSLQKEIDEHATSTPFYQITPSAIHLEGSVLFYTSEFVSLGVGAAAAVDIEPHPLYHISLSPLLSYRIEKNDRTDKISFCLPISYCNLYGMGVGGGIVYQVSRYSQQKNYKLHYRCQLNYTDIGFLAASGKIEFRFGVAMEKLP